VLDLLFVQAQLLAGVIEKPIRTAQRARQIVAHLDDVFANRLVVEQRVEAHHRFDFGRLHAHDAGHIADCSRRAIAVFLLRDV
jgi:hypothetical protein